MRDNLQEYLGDGKLQRVLDLVGVYSIFNMWTSKSYIGSTSRSFRDRLNEHYEQLKASKHSNSKLQNSYNYNPSSFSFDIIESYVKGTISPEDLIKREQYFIDTLTPEFNALKDADYRKGYTPSSERIRWIITDPEGEVFQVAELAPFCKEYRESHKGVTVNARYLSDLAMKKREQYKGWSSVLAEGLDDNEYKLNITQEK